MLHTKFCIEADRYGCSPDRGCEGSAATKDEGISLFATDLPASGLDCARAELCKNTHASRQKHFAVFTTLNLNRVCGSAENWSGGSAVQWMGSDNCLEYLWPSKFRFRSWLQPKMAGLLGLVAEK